MFVLELLGTLSLRSDTLQVPVSAQQKRSLGLLAVIALGGRQGVPRDRIEAYLWPDSSAELARHSLDQAVYAIRRALGTDSVLSTGRELRLNPEFVQTDLWEFEEAIRAGQWVAAIGHYKGSLLDGFHFGDTHDLEFWITTERARLRMEYQSALANLASVSAGAGDHLQSVAWCRRLANSDPLSADATKKLMRALAAAGDRASAVKQARLYQELIRQELEMEPDSEIESLASTFSRPVDIEMVGTSARPTAPAVVAEAASRHLLPRNPPRSKHSRVAAVLSFSILTVSLIGAATVESRQSQNHRTNLRPSTARVESKIALPAARDSYVRALQAWSDGSKDGLDTAVAYFRRAIELDPDYAEAYAGLADAYVMLGYFGYRQRDAEFPKAKAAALRSLQLDSTLASARPALAYVLTWERDFAGADSEFRKAVALDPTYVTAKTTESDPTYVTAHQWYTILLMILGEEPRAVAGSPRPVNQSPFSLNPPIIELTFTKWVSTYPTFTGVTSYGPGTIAVEMLSRIDDGVFTHLSARYELTDPGGTHSFKAVLQGKSNNREGNYNLNGIVTWGFMLGARVHATFHRVTPCEFGKLNVCFQGTLQLQRE
jgi:DNA-binding SARP family transcriptional activator/Tfp pilus assembly protein PilF